MTDNTALLALAERVESATGPERELDAEIVCALNRRPDWLRGSRGTLWVDRSGHHTVVRFADERMKRSSGNPSVDEVPHFTASIDAAMTLVNDNPAMETAQAPGNTLCHAAMWVAEKWHMGAAKTLPLTICAAALRARAATGAR